MTKTMRLLAASFGLSLLVSTADAQAPVASLTTRPNSDVVMGHLDSAMAVFHDKHYSFKDDIEKLNIYGFDTTDVPTYSADVISYRLDMLESPIPLTYNQYVKGYIDLYAVKKKKLTQHILTWSSYYFPMFEQILDQQGLPLEFKYLAVIESALNPHAQSWCGATGLWQFMYGTGLMYGLKINGYVDERKDPIKATYAACQYFKDMYARYGDWLLVIAAYNCGPGNVDRAVRMSGGSHNFWTIMNYLPMETRGYVPAFIGATYVLNYHKEHNIFPFAQPVDFVTDTVHVDSKVSFAQLSKSLDMTQEQLMMLNPSYKLNMVPFTTNEKTHVIRLPYDKAISFADLKENIFASEIQSTPNYGYYTQPTVAPRAKPAAYKAPAKKNGNVYHRVKNGEGLYNIASRYGVTRAEIKRWNGLKNNYIYPGQNLSIWARK